MVYTSLILHLNWSSEPIGFQRLRISQKRKLGKKILILIRKQTYCKNAVISTKKSNLYDLLYILLKLQAIKRINVKDLETFSTLQIFYNSNSSFSNQKYI